MPNFHCEYGHNIMIGNNVLINFNSIIMDNAEVIIGDDVLIGPNAGIYTVNHAIVPDERAKGICICKPVHIENKVWFGADVKVLAGAFNEHCELGVVLSPSSALLHLMRSIYPADV